MTRQTLIAVVTTLFISLVSAQKVTEYSVPSSRPHDVTPAPDGSAW